MSYLGAALDSKPTAIHGFRKHTHKVLLNKLLRDIFSMHNIKTVSTKYLYERNGIFYIRIQNPPFAFSLRTNNLNVSLKALSYFTARLLQLRKKGISSKLLSELKEETLMIINPIELAEEIVDIFNLPPKDNYDTSDFSDHAFSELGNLQYQALNGGGLFKEPRQEVLLALSYMSNEYRKIYWDSKHFSDDTSSQLDKVRALLKAKIERDFIKERQLENLFKEKNTNEKISSYFEKFLDEIQNSRNPSSENRVKQFNDSFKEFLFVKGDISPIELTKLKVEGFIDTLYLLPPSRHRGNSTLDELLDSGNPPRKHSTIEKYYQRYNQFFSWLVANDVVASNPFIGVQLKPNDDDSGWASYTPDEIALIKEKLKDYSGWKYWIPMLAIYTGARASELGQLQAQDVKFDKETSRYYLDLMTLNEGQSIKTESGKRIIPLHKIFSDWAQEASTKPNNTNIWEGLAPRNNEPYSKPIGDFFRMNFFPKLGIPKETANGRRKVFHSFRTTFINETFQRHPDKLGLLQLIVGHSNKELKQTASYIRKENINITKLTTLVDWQE